MNKYTTKKGNVVFWDIDYSLGGYNYATYEKMKRGYYLTVKRNANEYIVFQGLEHESGAVRVFLHEVTRQSVKQEKIAAEKAQSKLIEIVNSYNL